MVDIYTPNKYWLDIKLKGCRVTKISIPKTPTKKCLICDTKLQGNQKKFCSPACRSLCSVLTSLNGLRFLTYIRDEGRCVSCEEGTYLRYGKNLYAPPGTGEPSTHDWYELIHLPDGYSPGIITKAGSLARGEVDHVVPTTSNGLAFNLSNLQLLCKPCHTIKTSLEVGSSPKVRKMNETIIFRISKKDKEELEMIADELGITLGELCRRSISTIEVLFDPDMTLSRLIEQAGVLKNRPDWPRG